MNITDYITLTYNFQYDVNYETLYSARTSSNYSCFYEMFGFGFGSSTKASATLTLLNLYTFSPEVKFIPLKVIPYKQYVAYVRPVALLWDLMAGKTPQFDIQLKGSYDVSFLELSASNT